MKRILCLFITLLLIASFSACGNGAQFSTPSLTSPAASASPSAAPSSSTPASPSKTWEIPTTASPPDMMTVDQILYIVNERLGYHDDAEKMFTKEDAEVFDVSDSAEEDEVLYFFTRGDLEIVLFASKEKDGVVGAYVRALYEDDKVEEYMMSCAGVFLAALEPKAYEDMLKEALPTGTEESGQSKTSAGEAWRVTYRRTLINITPKEDAGQVSGN